MSAFIVDKSDIVAILAAAMSAGSANQLRDGTLGDIRPQPAYVAPWRPLGSPYAFHRRRYQPDASHLLGTLNAVHDT